MNIKPTRKVRSIITDVAPRFPERAAASFEGRPMPQKAWDAVVARLEVDAAAARTIG